MKEVWKDIPNYEGLYQVSSHGRVKSFRQSTKCHCEKEYILKPHLANNGYYQVTLYDNTVKHKFSVHRLVAEAFIPNPNGYPQVNHKDENRLNNLVTNLEWCSSEYNNAYGTARIRQIDTKSTPVEQLTIDGKIIAIYRSAKIAREIIGVASSSLYYAIKHGSNCKGYFWRYSDHTF